MAIDKKILSWVERKHYDDYDFAVKCGRYDNMVALNWEIPPSFTQYDWIRKRVSTVPHDIIKQSCNIFDTYNPKFEILPRGDVERDTEPLERWGEFHMKMANQAGETEPFRDAMRQSVTYDKICLQVECLEDLPYDEKPAYPYCIYPYHPSTVHSERGGGALQKVATVNILWATEVIDHWKVYATDSDKGKTIKAAVAKLEAVVDEDDSACVVYVDYMDKKRRVVFFEKTEDETIPKEFEFGKEQTVILDAPNKNGYINWVVVKGSSGSILESLDAGGLWENQCFLDTMADTTVIRRGWFPEFLLESSVPGAEIDIDHTADAAGVLTAPPGSRVTQLIPPPLDPGIRELMDRNNAKMNSSSGIQNLSGIDAVNVQSATLNTVVQLKMTELQPYVRNAEKALAEAMKILFLSAKKSKTPVVGQRLTDSRYGAKGQKIALAAGDFNPEDLIITCELLANNKTDMMQRVNEYATLAKMGFHIPMSEFTERMGFGDPNKLDKAWLEEQIQNANLQAFIQKIMAQTQLETQAAQMQMQLQAQQTAQPQGANPMQNGQNAPVGGNPSMQTGFEQAGGQQNNPAMGGSSPYESVPQGTQTVMQ